jgi:hypothetical protein
MADDRSPTRTLSWPQRSDLMCRIRRGSGIGLVRFVSDRDHLVIIDTPGPAADEDTLARAHQLQILGTLQLSKPA